MKKISIDLDEETHKELVKKQLQVFIETDSKPSLGDLIRQALAQFLDNKKASQ